MKRRRYLVRPVGCWTGCWRCVAPVGAAPRRVRWHLCCAHGLERAVEFMEGAIEARDPDRAYRAASLAASCARELCGWKRGAVI